MVSIPKKIFSIFAVMLMTETSLFAQSQSEPVCCPPPCCGVSCCPGPYCRGPNCIDPYCNEFNIKGELLYWIGQLTGLQTAFGNTAVVTTTSPTTGFITTTITETEVQPSFQWRPGFRVGANYAYTCLLFEVDWTHYDGRAHFNRDAQHGYWKIQYDTLDFIVGRRCCVAPCFYFLPFVGLRGLRVHQSLSSNLDTEFVAGAVGTNTVFTYKHDKERIWGIGPELGVEADWYLGRLISLYGSFDVVTYYGNVNGSYDQVDTFPLNASVSNAHNHSRFNVIGTDLAIGLRYDKVWCIASEGLFTAKVGLEQHRIYEFSNLASDGTLSLDGANLMLDLGYRY